MASTIGRFSLWSTAIVVAIALIAVILGMVR
jgi:hypothetical protein